MYERDNNYKFPNADHWMDQITPYLEQIASYRQAPSVFYDPFRPGQKRYGYALNRNCSSKPLSAFASPSSTVAVFDSTLGTRNASDTGHSVRVNPSASSRLNNTSGTGYGFVDGHAKWIPLGIHPSFLIDSGPMTGLPYLAYPGATSVLGTWVSSGDGSARTALIFRPGGIVEEVGPWPGDPHKVAHSYGRYNERETTLKYIFTRVWIEGSPMYTVTPEKHIMDYMLAGDILTIGLRGKYENVYRRSHAYTTRKPKGFLWV